MLSPVRPRRTSSAPAVKTIPDARRAARERCAAPGMDRAFYECGCGNAFRAEVSTTVGCPRCGGGQPW